MKKFLQQITDCSRLISETLVSFSHLAFATSEVWHMGNVSSDRHESFQQMETRIVEQVLTD